MSSTLDFFAPMEQCLVSRFRRYYEIEVPRAAQQRKRWPLLIGLHGYQGDMTSMMRVARRIADGKMIVISLQGPFQFFLRDGNDPKNFRVGFGWGTTWKMDESIELHHRDLRTLIDLAVRRYHAEQRQVFLLAFSQACSYNYRFVFTHPHAVRGAIAVCGGVPGDWAENATYRAASTHVLHIAASRDEWYSREKNLLFRRQLAERARTLDFRFYNSPHKFPRSSIPHIRRWIQKHL